MSFDRRVGPGLFALFALLVLSACAPAGDASEAPPPTRSVPAESGRQSGAQSIAAQPQRILLLTAMPIELAPLLQNTRVERVVTINGRRHHVGVLEGVDVVLVAAGISMVNATMGAQAALDHFNVSAVIFAGIAGGANPNIHIGDVTVPARWAQYQEHVFTDASRTGWRRGWRNEDLGNFGVMYPQRVRASSPAGEADAEELKLWFDVDPGLLARVERLVPQIALDRCTEDGACADDEPRVLVGGNGVSGPTFVDDAAYRDWVWDTFAPDGFDMETAAVGHVAHANGVPYLGVRSISDMAGGNPNENRVESFAPIAARNAAAVVRALLADLR